MFAKGNSQEKQRAGSFWAREKEALIRHAQILFLLLNILFFAFGFFVLDSYVKKMADDEFTSLAKTTVRTVVGDFSDLELSLDAIGTLLSVYDLSDRESLLRRVQGQAMKLENFDQLLWLYQDTEGAWRFYKVSEKADEDGLLYRIKPDAAFINYFIENDIISSPGLQIMANLNYEQSGTRKTPAGRMSYTESAEPFALVKAINPGDPQAGVVVGLVNATSVLMKDAFENPEQIADMHIRDVTLGQTLYQWRHEDFEPLEDFELNQSYEFDFSGSRWEVRASFFAGNKVRFLRSLPYVFVLFGGVMTVLGFIYVHNNSRQAVKLSKIHKKLRKSNIQLRSEVEKRAELNEALAQAEQENRAIINAVSDIIFELDEQGQILFVNETWQKITGFEVDQSLGLDMFKMLHPHDQEPQREDFQKLLKKAKQPYRSFTRLRTAQGNFRAVEISFSMTHQDEYKRWRVVGTIIDVEERRRAERALSEAEKKYRAIVENAAGGIYQVTPEGVYLSVNPAMARILGYKSPEDLLHKVKNANEQIYVDGKKRASFLRRLDNEENAANCEVLVCREDGGNIWVNENVRAVRENDGHVLYYEGSMDDITQRKKSDVALREAKVHSDLANRAKSEFLANMSHELRTPLNAIIGFSEIIKSQAFGPIEQKEYGEYATHIYESGQNLLAVINEILDVSKIEAGDRQLDESLVNLQTVINGCLKLMKTKIDEHNLAVSYVADEAAQVVGEEVAIKQVLMNLLSNAVKFTPPHGRITITHELNGSGALRLSISDTGPGLDEQEIEKAISPFGQINNQANRKTSGTGLGLTLVDALMKLHGGELELFSQKGFGTTASVIFPPSRVRMKKAERAKDIDSAES